MKRLLGLLLAFAAGCSGFDRPTTELLKILPRDPLEEPPVSLRPTTYSRCRFQMSIDSPSLAGEFEGVVVAKSDSLGTVVRAQLFGDLGPKVLELMARRDRIVGYFPHTREAVDCALPSEAKPHLLLFLGASLLEEFVLPGTRYRVTGVREEEDGSWFRLRPAIEGMSSLTFMSLSGEAKKRSLSWMYGLTWEEDWPTPQECRVSASNLSIRVKILERQRGSPVDPEAFELKLPADVKIVAGSRK